MGIDFFGWRWDLKKKNWVFFGCFLVFLLFWGGVFAGELKTFFPYFFWSRIRTEIRGFFWPWPWRISRISVRVSVLAEVGAN